MGLCLCSHAWTRRNSLNCFELVRTRYVQFGRDEPVFDGAEQLGVDVTSKESGFFRGMIFGATFVTMFDSLVNTINKVNKFLGLPELAPQSGEITYDPFSNLPWPWNWIVPKLVEIVWFLIVDVLASGGPIGYLAYTIGSYVASSLLSNLFRIVLNRIYVKHR